MPQKSQFALLMAAWSIAHAAVAGGQAIELTRSSIDGGGTTQSTGGRFELSATVGQPDAGVLAGDGLELAGGLWFPLAPGDCDDDDVVGLFDHVAFAACLSGPDGGVIERCGCYDVDATGGVDLRDFAAFQTAFDAW